MHTVLTEVLLIWGDSGGLVEIMRHTVPWHCHCGSPASWFAQSLQVGKLLARLGKGRVGERKLMADGVLLKILVQAWCPEQDEILGSEEGFMEEEEWPSVGFQEGKLGPRKRAERAEGGEVSRNNLPQTPNSCCSYLQA